MDFKISEALSETIISLFNALPNIIMAILVFIIGFILIKIITKILKKVFEKIGIDKLGEKLQSIDIIAQSNIEIKISEVLVKGIYYFLMLFVIIISTDILGLEVVSNLISDILNFLPNLLVALIVLILGTLFADLVKKFVDTALSSLSIPSSKLIANFIFYFLFINVLIIALSQSGIKTDFLAQNITMIIGGAVLAFAISYGLAARTSVANYLASFYIKDKFELGDTIVFENTKGKIIDLDKSSCTVKTNEGKVVIPLNLLSEKTVLIEA